MEFSCVCHDCAQMADCFRVSVLSIETEIQEFINEHFNDSNDNVQEQI